MVTLAQLTCFAILIAGFLLAAAFTGFALLRAYEEFRKGVEQRKKIRIWAAFFIVSFLFIIMTFAIVRGFA